MAFNPNLPIAKVTYEDDVLIDLTSDTVAASNLLTGYTAHNSAGASITGACDYNCDTSSDTVTAPNILSGYTAHNASGNSITGSCTYNCNTSSDTVTSSTLASGSTAHNAAGQQITGTMTSVTVESKTITENGTYTAESGKAFSPVTVNVSGGGGAALAKADLDANGAVIGVSSLNVSNIVTIGASKLQYWQTGNTSLAGSLAFSALTEIDDSGLQYAFQSCSGVTSVSFPALITINTSGLRFAFQGCSGITTVSFPTLTTITGNYGIQNAFEDCSGLTSISFPALTSVGNNGLWSTFKDCSGLTTVSFPSLTTLSSYIFGRTATIYTFANCTALTEIHFREDMQSTIEAYTGYSAKFGATNATIYFDL